LKSIQYISNFCSNEYRFGFNGKEKDNEVKGIGNQQDYGMRIYDPRIGRFLSVDPLFKSYAWYTPYQFAGNKPISCIDLDGLEDYLVINYYDGKSYMGKSIIILSDDMKVDINSHKVVYTSMYLNSSEENKKFFKEPIYLQNRLIYDRNKNNKFFSGTWEKSFRKEDQKMIDEGLKSWDNYKKTNYADKFAQQEPEYLITIQMPSPESVTFETGKAILNNDGMKELDKLATFMILNPNSSFSIEGHTDDVGNKKSNLDLSLNRAQAAKEYLIDKYNFDPNRLNTEGKGDSDPKVEGTSDEARSKNRRIEFIPTTE